jgi:hypothetical protein
MRDRKCIREGTCYPTNYVGALVDRRADADAAAEALRAAGFADVELFHGEDAYAAIREASRHENAFTRAWRRVRDHGDEGELHAHYLATLRRGGSYLIAYAPAPDQVRQAHDILVAHHAHDIWRLGAWTVERLTEYLPDEYTTHMPEQHADTSASL